MKVSVIGNKRRDGKYKVKLYFPGGPNMFGGYYHGRSFTKLYTTEKLIETLTSPGLEEMTNIPAEIRELL